ncbi:MAG: DNA helicase RecQ [Rectinemataceae bacterium]|jgi:ATP-dependent DNA helicase RecQ
MSARAREVLKEVFGYDEFRPLQEEIIEAVTAGEDLLAVMPTGGGKSLCYQVPALTLRSDALVLVVSPLIALMREQVAFLRALGVEARFLNSTLAPEEWTANAEAAANGQVRLLYLAPETLASGRASPLLERATIDLLAVDEAHCISEWGHDFRPEYRTLGGIRKRLKGRSGLAPCLALTATATERVRKDIVAELGLRGSKVYVAGFDRPNIFLEVRRRARAVDQVLELASAFPAGSGIVYCFSRARAEAFAADLRARGLSALPYHAGLPDEERSANQDRFIRDEVRVICATTAFGMGIDKPDVRFLVHADLPKSLEQYYQEVGRAGRDGLPAHALLLFAYGDAMKIRSLMASGEGDPASSAQAEAALRGMLRYAEAAGCRRVGLLAHFGEDYGRPGCGACDVCACSTDAAAETDVTTQAYKLLSCVKRTGERYGAGHVVDVLVGSKNERVLGLGHAELSTWGIGKEWSRGQWLDISAQLLRKGYLAKDEEFGVLSLTEKAYAAFREKSPIAAVVPPRPKGNRAGGARGAGAPSTARPKAGSREAAVEDSLRALRRRLAEGQRVPNYVIFSDRTLYDLIAKAPADRAALLEVFGMGEVKARRFGRAILELLAGSSAKGDPAL